MAGSARDKLIKQLADAQREQENATMSLIQLELDERLLTPLGAREDQAASALRSALEALEGPLARLAEMDAGIVVAEGRCVEWSQKIAAGDPDQKADARSHFNEWSAHIDVLRAERDEAERGYLPLVEEREQCRKELRAMHTAKRMVVAAMLDPFGELGQQTDAYVSFRMPHLNHVLLRNDREDPEWPKAIAEMEELAMRSGWRSDGLPSDAEMAARALQMSGMADALATPPDPSPSMAEVIALDKAGMTNSALQDSPSRIEDHRNTPPVPRSAPVRDWMQLPGRGAR